MRKTVKNFVQQIVGVIPIIGPIYEFGALQVPGHEGFADLRDLFPNLHYVGADIQTGIGVDSILDIQKIDLPSESVGAVLVLDTLEHVEFPRKAVEESYRILKPDGVFIISSVMCFPIHDYPHDYWRFTPEGFKSLLKIFNLSFVESAGPKNFPDVVFGIGIKGMTLKPKLEQLTKTLQKNNTLKTGWKEIMLPFTPPLVWSFYQKLIENIYKK